MDTGETDSASNIPMTLPEKAVEEVQKFYKGGAKLRAYYRLNGEVIWFREWNPQGVLIVENGLKDGYRHGPYRSYHNNGQLNEERFYVNNVEHGIARQYDYDGKLIGSYSMHFGTGVDLWYQEKGVLSEEREYVDGAVHGFERWYFMDGKTLFQESHFKQGIEHGIFRDWNSKGGMCRGYPRYFVNGQRVTKRQYLKACETDDSLPRFREIDQINRREPLKPEAVFE